MASMDASQQSYYDKYVSICESKGGKMLSDAYYAWDQKMLVRCKGGHEWYMTATNIGKGSWCKKCFDASRKKDITEVRQFVEAKGGRLISTEYVNNASKLSVQCEKGHQWDISWSNIKNGYWCPICANNRKKPIDELRQFIEDRGGNLLSTEYTGAHDHILVECDRGHHWTTTWHSLQKESWCIYCSGSPLKTIEELQFFATSKGGKLLSTEYVGTKSMLSWQCEFGHEWSTSWSNIQAGCWCNVCAKNQKKDIKELQEYAIARRGKLLSTEYINSITKMLWQCELGHSWYTPWCTIYSGCWCPVCRKSKGEFAVSLILNKWKVKYNTQHVIQPLNNRRYDLYFEIEGQKYIVEFDGRQHFDSIEFFDKRQSLEERQEVDIIKSYLAVNTGHVLIRIDHTQLDDVEKHLITAITAGKWTYFSTPPMYTWLIQPSTEQLIKHGLMKPKLTMKIVE